MRFKFISAALGVPVLGAFAKALQAEAAPPNQRIAHWDEDAECVTAQSWVENTESAVKDTLPNEWYAGSSPIQSLRGGATIIRQNSWAKHNIPEAPYVEFCDRVPYYDFDWRDSRMVYRPNSEHSRSNDAVNITWGKGWRDGQYGYNALWLNFGNCLQNDMDWNALSGWSWPALVGSPVYPPGQYAPENACGNDVHEDMEWGGPHNGFLYTP